MDTLIRIYKSSPHASLDNTNETDGTNAQKTDEQNKYDEIEFIWNVYFSNIVCREKQIKINEHENELTRRISTGKFAHF